MEPPRLAQYERRPPGWLRFFLFLFLAFLFQFTLQTAIAAELKPIHIGIASNASEISTNSDNIFQKYLLEGALLAIQEHEEDLARLGYKIIPVHFDYGNNALNVQNIVVYSVSSPILVMLGYVGSTEALLAGPLHQQHQIPMLTPSASATRISHMGNYVHAFETSNDVQGKILSEFAKDQLQAKNAAVILVADCSYCQDLANSFVMEFTRLGGRISNKILVSSQDDSYVDELNDVDLDAADIIFVPDMEYEAGKIVTALLKKGVNKTFLGGDGWGYSGLKILKLTEGMPFTSYSLTHWHPDIPNQKSKDFVQAIRKKYGHDPDSSITALSYDATKLLLSQIPKMTALTRQEMERVLSLPIVFEGITGKVVLQPKESIVKPMVLLFSDGKRFYYKGLLGPKP